MNLEFEYKGNHRIIKSKNENIIIGLDIPDYIIGYNDKKLKSLNEADAIIAGYIMWEISRCGAIAAEKSVIDLFSGDTENKNTFGENLVILNSISGCLKPSDYTTKFNYLLENRKDKVKEFPLENLSNFFTKIGIALNNNIKLSLIKQSEINSVKESESNMSVKDVLMEYDLETNFNGYPLEDLDRIVADQVQKILLENSCKRYSKNKKYKLKLIVEEYGL